MQFLHTMIRVGDLDRSVDFYTNIMGLTHVRTSPNAKYKYTNVFLASENGVELELTYNWGVTKYDHGGAFGHIAFAVKDVSAVCAEIKKKGGNVTREAGPVKGGSTIIAFVTDPDGYQIELVQRP